MGLPGPVCTTKVLFFLFVLKELKRENYEKDRSETCTLAILPHTMLYVFSFFILYREIDEDSVESVAKCAF